MPQLSFSVWVITIPWCLPILWKLMASLPFGVTALSLVVYLLEVPSRQRTPGSFVPWRF